MPLFLRALPLSFRTFWRYLVVLPFLAIVTAFFAIMAAFVPLANWLVLPVMAVLASLAGLRCALFARGHRSETDFGRLPDASIRFCLLGMGVTFAADMLLRGLHRLAALAGLGTDTSMIPETGAGLGDLFEMLSAQSLVWYALVATGLAVPVVYAAVIAVPMTAAAAPASTTGRQPELTWGLGAGALGLMVPLVAWGLGGHVFAFFGEVWTMFALIGSAVYALATGREPFWEWSLSPLSLLGATVFMTWASSWFFATAVLAWERHAGHRAEVAATARRPATADSASDLRALREARSRRQKGGA